MAGTNFNPSWGDSVKWNNPAGGSGFGGGVSPGASFEPPTGFPSTGDSGFWKNQSTDENYYNKSKVDPKNFLDAFTKGLDGLNKNKYQDQAQQGGMQTGGRGEAPGANVEKIAPDISIYTPPTPYSPFTVQGVQGGKSGVGGALGTLAGIGASFIPGIGPGIAAALPGIGGSVGGMFG